MHPLARITLIAGLLAVSTLFAAPLLAAPPTHHSYKWDFEPKRDYARVPDLGSPMCDIEHYDIAVTLDEVTETITGRVVVQGHATMNHMIQLHLHMGTNLDLDAVESEGAPLDYERSADLLTIALPGPLSLGDPFAVEIAYHGEGSPGDYGLMFDQHGEGRTAPIIWTNCEPEGARLWFPCYDAPIDKATATLAITASADLIVASNGRMTGVDDHGDTKTWHFQENYPIATYLVSVNASDFAVIDSVYFSDDLESMPITHYVWPEDSAAAHEDFSITVDALSFCAQRFGEYPFFSEKYGMIEIPWGGAMENQTLTSFGSELITGDHMFDNILVHEASHQWFGDDVTPADWAEIWLNEGFATYTEALWYADVYGEEILPYVMDIFRWVYFAYHPDNHHPLYNPPPGHLFCLGEYYKGSWVLHQLRKVIGDEAFFATLLNYATEHAGGNVTTPDFRRAAEEASGMPLAWFFDQWIYGPGHPIIEYEWTAEPVSRMSRDSDFGVLLTIEQLQEWDPFIVPMDVRVYTADGETDMMFWLNERTERFGFTVSAEPDSIKLDPNVWVFGIFVDDRDELLATAENELPARLSVFPNPCFGSVAIRVPHGGAEATQLQIFDVEGRLVRRVDEVLSDAVRWDGRDQSGRPATPGVYFLRLLSGDQTWNAKILKAE